MAVLWVFICAFLSLAMAQRILYLPKSCYRQPDESKCMMGYPKYFFNTTTEECELTQNTRCSGRRPSFFTTVRRCMRRCGCRTAPDPGPCDANEQRYYYNSRFRMCVPFSYGGCEGNFNNFKTFFQCQWMCRSGFLSNLFD